MIYLVNFDLKSIYTRAKHLKIPCALFIYILEISCIIKLFEISGKWISSDGISSCNSFDSDFNKYVLT
jgi:hypothetical protein